MAHEIQPFADLGAFTALARITGLALSQDGARLVVSVQQPDPEGAKYVSAIWQIDPDGQRPPLRLTRSEKGESAPAFLPDGSLLFVSARPDGEGEDEPQLWQLPCGGEASVLASYPGGVGGPVVARAAGAVLVSGARLLGAEGDGAEHRKVRRERKITAILHTGMPIRYWDHEVGDESPRLLLARLDAGVPIDLAPDAEFELLEGSYDISADGQRVVTT